MQTPSDLVVDITEASGASHVEHLAMCDPIRADECGLVVNIALEPKRTDSQAWFVGFDGLDWDEFLPFAEWTDEHWRDATFDSSVTVPPGDPLANSSPSRQLP